MKWLLSCCLLAALACGGSGGPTGPDDENGIIRVQNSSTIAVVEVNMSRCEVAEWGANRLTNPIGGPDSRHHYRGGALLRSGAHAREHAGPGGRRPSRCVPS